MNSQKLLSTNVTLTIDGNELVYEYPNTNAIRLNIRDVYHIKKYNLLNFISKKIKTYVKFMLLSGVLIFLMLYFNFETFLSVLAILISIYVYTNDKNEKFQFSLLELRNKCIDLVEKSDLLNYTFDRRCLLDVNHGSKICKIRSNEKFKNEIFDKHVNLIMSSNFGQNETVIVMASYLSILIADVEDS